MNNRRIEFTIIAGHATTLTQLKESPEIIAGIIKNTPDTQLDRAHFKNVTEMGYVLEAVYFVNNADYNKYMDIQQRINFEIKGVFEKKGIEFARQDFFPKAS